MSRVKRIDVGTLAKPVMRDDGTMVADARITRTGVFVYKNADGSERREYRPDSSVFDQRSLESFKLVPLTDEHPPEMLNANNARQYSIGVVGESVRRDGNHIAARIVIHDAATIAKVTSGKVYLSCGYEAELVMTPGISPEGERYDCVQTDIIGNHLAIVYSPRAGHTAAIRVDAECSNAPSPKEETMPDETLKNACSNHGTRYDSDDERGSALRLLEQLGYPGSFVTSSGRLDSKSDVYVMSYAACIAKHESESIQAQLFATDRTDAGEVVYDSNDHDPSPAEIFRRRQEMLPRARVNVQRNHKDNSQPTVDELNSEIDRLLALNPRPSKPRVSKPQVPSQKHTDDTKRSAAYVASRFIKPGTGKGGAQ